MKATKRTPEIMVNDLRHIDHELESQDEEEQKDNQREQVLTKRHCTALTDIPLIPGLLRLHCNNRTSVSSNIIIDHEDPKELEFHIRFPDLIELKQWVQGLDDMTIFRNHLIAANFTRCNLKTTFTSSCGASAQGMMNLLLERCGHTFSDVIKESQWNDSLLGDHNLILVSIGSCSCCLFPGHAFVIYCSDYLCVILQSFIHCYTIRDFFDIIPRHKVNKYMNVFMEMYTCGINENTLNKLARLTHVCFNKYKDCKLEKSTILIFHCKNNQIFKS